MSVTIYGIDVSKHQGSIDWAKVAATGKTFAFVRLGWCGYDGMIAANGGLDPLFEQNANGAAAAGLQVGAYLYSYAKTADAAAVAAAETLALLAGYDLTYPVAFDIEDSVNLNLSKSTNTAIAAAFLSGIAAGGYYPMLYTYKSFAQTNLDMSALSGYEVWIAQYAAANTYDGDCGIWQYSSTGSVDGVSGNCDLDVAYKDYAALIAQAGLNGQGTGGEEDEDTDTGSDSDADKSLIRTVAEAAQDGIATATAAIDAANATKSE